MTVKKKRILGIDPGLNHTGFGVIDAYADRCVFVSAGCIHIPAGDLCDRLACIYRELAKIIAETHPDCAACEIIFLNINARSTLLLGQARGAAISCAGVHGLNVAEYTPSVIKQSVVGTGRAAKAQVQMMVGKLLSLPQADLQPDAADALACAITRANAEKLSVVEQSAAARSPTGVVSLRSSKKRRNAWAAFVNERNLKK